jgi:mRNA interferase MazF
MGVNKIEFIERLEQFKIIFDKAVGDDRTYSMFCDEVNADPLFMKSLLEGKTRNFPSPWILKNIASKSADKSVTYDLLLRVTGVAKRELERVSDRILYRLDIYMVDLGDGVGSEQYGLRPCLLVGNQKCLESNPVIPVVPITSRQKSNLATHINIGQECGLNEVSTILTEQLRNIDRSRLKQYIGSVSNVEDRERIDKAIKIAVGCYGFADVVSENIEKIDRVQTNEITREELFSFKKVWNYLKLKNKNRELKFNDV